MNTINTIIAQLEAATDKKAIRDIVWTLSGDDNRFLRQQLTEALIGIKHPIAKCGVGALEAFANTYLANRNSMDKALAEAKPAKAVAVEAVPEPIAEATAEPIAEAPAPEPAKPAKTEKQQSAGSLAEATITVGMKVVRKECQRKGEVTAIEGQHVIVTLEDGSKRKPCMSRFRKLYIAA